MLKEKEVPTGYAQNFLIKKNLAKEATAQAVGELRGKQKSEEKAHAEMIAEAKAIKAKLEAEETVVEFVEKVGPPSLTRKLQKNCKSSLVLRLTNAIFKCKHQFEQ